MTDKQELHYEANYIDDFTDYERWPYQLSAAALDFQRRYGMYPNAMGACAATFLKMDLVASRKGMLVFDSNGQPPEEGQFVELCSFQGLDYMLYFFEDESIPESVYLLTYDASHSPTDFDGSGGSAG
ncbi:MAG: hypothetical protein KDK39_13930, partial [Leptospiraceae bacterium]|nr:hypothetical protein [Leptospiraceae bacterium]